MDRRHRASARLMRLGMTASVLALGISVALAGGRGGQGGPPKPTHSGPIALTPDDRFVWVVNPDNNSVSLIEVANDLNLKRAEIRVGQEPQNVAVTPDGGKVYVTNMVSGTVSVLSAATRRVTRVIPVGTEPFGCALTPDGSKLYVANFNSDSVSVISTATDSVVKTIANVGPKPRAIAVSLDGKVYVTQFLALLREDGRPVTQKEGFDDGREGRVTVLSTATDAVTGTVVLPPVADTGFSSNGTTLGRVAPTNPPTFTHVTGAFPNLLESITIRGNRAYIPNTAESPDGPFRFDTNVQGFLSVFNTTTDADSGQTLNMNRGINLESATTKLFCTNPFAVAFKNHSDEGYVALGAVNRLVRVELNGAGTPTVNAPTAPGDPGAVVRVEVGKNPRGVVINSTDTRAYVMNYVSRDVSVVDISDETPTEIARVASASLPTPGTLEAIVQHGKDLFNTGIGPEGTVDGARAPAGRMSNFGWGACYSCHPNGLTDATTWMFPDGPRQSISMESTGEHPQTPILGVNINANGAPITPAFHQRPLNYSAVRDEVQDFELNTRAVSGGQGLITDGQAVVNLTPTSTTGRSADQDAIAAYVVFGIRAPISPLRPTNFAPPSPDIAAGRALFASANCQSCHGGPNWTRARLNYTPPPNPALVVGGQLAQFLFPVGTFDPNLFNDGVSNEIRQVANNIANGALGFNNPSLLSIFAGAPYLHSGTARTLDEVLENVTHRAAGTGGVDTLSNPADRAKLVQFLKSIDPKTPIFP